MAAKSWRRRPTWHLIDQGRVHPAVAVAPAYQFKTTEASREAPKRQDGGAVLLPIEVGKTFGPVTVYGEGGVSSSRTPVTRGSTV